MAMFRQMFADESKHPDCDFVSIGFTPVGRQLVSYQAKHTASRHPPSRSGFAGAGGGVAAVNLRSQM